MAIATTTSSSRTGAFSDFLKGDKVLWLVIIVISIGSIFPVYSASSNLEYIVNNGTTTGHLVKHIIFIIVGLGLMKFMTTFKIEMLGRLSIFLLIICIVLLLYTSYAGTSIAGATASRWLRIPGVGISFQPSAFAYLSLIIYLCRFLTKNVLQQKSGWAVFGWIFLPITVVVSLVIRDNGSTGLMILIVSIAVLIIGQLKIKYVAIFMGLASLLMGIFLILALNTTLFSANRVHTWMSRIETHFSKGDEIDRQTEEDKAKNYQVMQAKAAIVHGGVTGIGPGKSALKQMLPQSASDFIFAIIVEEYGLLGALALLGAYFMMMMRIIIIAQKMPTFFGTLLAISMGLMIFLQLSVNIAVALSLIPVTGQPLPLISYGGSAMLVTYIQLGLVLNISSRIQVYDEEGIGKKQSVEEINDIA